MGIILETILVFMAFLGFAGAFAPILNYDTFSLHHFKGPLLIQTRSSLMMVTKKNKSTKVSINSKNKKEVNQIGSKLKTMQEFIDQFNQVKKLSEDAPDLNLTKTAEALFDAMFKKWYENDNDELEPDTNIYNLLLAVYANCGEMEVAEKLLRRMETGRADYVPEPNIQSYEHYMKGWVIKGDLDKARDVFDHVATRGENDVILNVELCNTFLEMLIRSKEGDKAVKLSEDMIDRMITGELPSPTTDTFSHVLSCMIRNSDRRKGLKVREKVKRILERMENINGVNPNNANIVNMNIKSLSDVSRSETDAFEAERLLTEMLERYKMKSVMEERPNASAFINTIHAWKNVNSDQAAFRSRDILNTMKEFYALEKDRGNSVENLKPDNRVYNACLDVIARSNSYKKSIEAEELLQEMNTFYHENGDINVAPNQRTFNNIINACSHTTGGHDISKEALRIMFDAFKQMKNSERFQPNQASYGMILKGCSNLLADTAKRKNLIEQVFRTCCKEGHCSDFVLESLILATDTSFAQLICGVDLVSGKTIPAEWRRKLIQNQL